MALSVPHSEAFAKFIEQLVTNNNMSYMDAVLHFCESRDIEPESIAPLLSDKIRGAILTEGQALHMLKKVDALPLD